MIRSQLLIATRRVEYAGVCRVRRCSLYIGLLLGCAPLEDGTSVMRAFPAVDCDELPGRALVGWLGALLLCLGVPAVYASLIVMYLRRSFSSSLAHFLVRSIFSGHKVEPYSPCGCRLLYVASTGLAAVGRTRQWASASASLA